MCVCRGRVALKKREKTKNSTSNKELRAAHSKNRVKTLPPRQKKKNTYWIRLAACTSISSILYEFNSSLICCANCGVNRLHVAGSLRRSYIVAENVSYIDRLFANVSRFTGAVADRCESGGAPPLPDMLLSIVESAGAEEFRLGWLKMDFSGW
jgi:hypothetical protein